MGLSLRLSLRVEDTAPSADLRAGRPVPIQIKLKSSPVVQPVYYAYILRCADDSFYVGSAQDLDSRVKATTMAAVPHISSSIVPSNWFIPRLSNPKLPQFQGSGSSSAGVTEKSRHWWREIFDG